MNTLKKANVIYPVNEVSLNRWSPRAFSDKPVDPDHVRSIFEAGRWAPSATNVQPWRFLAGFNPDETWQKIFDTLADGNKIWVRPVPVLILAVAEKVYSRKDKEIQNHYYAYDTGQAVAHMTHEAAARGLYVHQMGGFDAEAASASFRIPNAFIPLAVIALGYIGDPSILPEDLKEREMAPRSRKGFGELIFSGTFGQKSTLFYEE